MTISTASDREDLSEVLAETVREAAANGRALQIRGGGTKTFYGRPLVGAPLDMAGHRGVTAYEPSELVITARAGEPLAAIEALLAGHGQMFAFEPPHYGPESTIGGVVATGLAGARRPFSGAVRDSLLGVKLLDGQGRVHRFGGTVFKNVAGFDAFRLQAGALGCLGALLEVSLRVAPGAAAEHLLSLEIDWPASRDLLISVLRSPSPVSGAVHDGERLHLRLSGAEQSVAACAARLGGEPDAPEFWEALRRRDQAVLRAERLWRLSIARTAPADEPPGRWFRDWAGGEVWLESDADPETIRAWARDHGGHATLFRGADKGEPVFSPLADPVLALHQRLKAAFDPQAVFNRGRMYQEF